MNQTEKAEHPVIFIILLILSGEAVFILPFVLQRVFRATFLDLFQLTNTQLGFCFSVYGIVALLSYLFGGLIADRFAPRKLMAVALWATALGGILLAFFPSYSQLKILYGYWGFTTIFLFWAAMIKATRIWGGNNAQGKAFGFLDGGRGLVGALFGLMGVGIFSIFTSSAIETISFEERMEAFQYVILTSSGLVAIIGILVYFFLKLPKVSEKKLQPTKTSLKNLKTVFQLPSVWLLMIIILCAYVGYKITDVVSLYAVEVMQYNEVKAAQTGTFLLFIRPIVGVVIGFLADKARASLYLLIGFSLSIVGGLIFWSGILGPQTNWLFFFSILVMAVGVYAARVLYFAVMREGKIPITVTGTAVGVISLVGYTPDIFAGPGMGYLLDSTPGEAGHQHVFLALTIFSIVGLLAAVIFYYLYGKNKKGLSQVL